MTHEAKKNVSVNREVVSHHAVTALYGVIALAGLAALGWVAVQTRFGYLIGVLALLIAGLVIMLHPGRD